MRTTLKVQAIRLIAIFLLICASTTTVKAQISQHPELYKVKEFHNMDKDGGALLLLHRRTILPREALRGLHR